MAVNSTPPQTERIRLLFVVPDLGVGGAERHVATLAPALDRERFEVRVCCIKQRGALFDDLVAAGVGALSLDSGTRQAPRALWRLVRIMRGFRPDVVITRGLNADILGRTAAAAARVPVVAIWKHNCGHISRGMLERVSERLLDPITHRYLGVAHGQVPYLVNELGWSADKIRVVHNGVDPAAFPFEPQRPPDADLRAELGVDGPGPVVAILAVLRPEKDHATFLRAARVVADRLPDVRFLIVGDGPERAALERLSADLTLTSRVSFAGMRADIPAVLGAVDLVVLSSYTIECFPYAVLEAMAMGRPAVSTAVGGLAELIDEGVTGRLVPARDPEALGDAIVSVAGDRETIDRMGRAARLRLEQNFSLQASAQRTAQVLEEAVADRGRSARTVAPPT